MKKKLTFLFLTMLMPTTLVISACDSVPEIDPSVIVEDEKDEEVPGSSEHVCQHVCAGCGKCLDNSCTDPACAEKCDCFTPLPQHTCHSVCFDCGKCTDLTCTDPVCADKCTCGGTTEVHTCGPFVLHAVNALMKVVQTLFVLKNVHAALLLKKKIQYGRLIFLYMV